MSKYTIIITGMLLSAICLFCYLVKKGCFTMAVNVKERDFMQAVSFSVENITSTPLSELNASIENGFSVKSYSEVSTSLDERTKETLSSLKRS